jgi:DNA-binding NtrC family response regulator
MKKLLLIEDEQSVGEYITDVANGMGFEVFVPKELSDGYARLQSTAYDLVIVDVQALMDFPFPGVKIKDEDGGFGGVSVLPIFIEQIINNKFITSFIVIARGGFPAEANFAIKHGAIDYIQIPMKRGDDKSDEFDLNRFHERLTGCLHRASTIIEKSKVEQLDLDGIIGTSAKIRNAISLLADAAGNDFNALIRGEVGTGKKLFAMKIHENSNRKDLDFIVVDCNSLQHPETSSDQLNDLFAANDPESLSIGTIVLHEISYLPISLQGKLLTLIQQNWQKDTKAGTGNGPVYRILSTSSKDLDGLMASNQFREDLYFELNTIELELPPLRERIEDIPQIAAFIIDTLSPKSTGSESIGMSADFISALKGYNWPGNITELKNAIKIAVANSGDGQALSPAFLPQKIISGSTISIFNESFPMDDTTVKQVFDIMNQTGVELGHGDAIQLQEEKISPKGLHISEKPEICFYESGNFWEVGPTGKTVPMKTLRGYGYIHFLLQRPNHFFHPVEVYKMSESEEASGSYLSEILSISGTTIQTSAFDKHSTYEKIDSKTRKSIETVIEELKEQLSANSHISIVEADEIKEKIRKYESLLRRKVERDPHSSHERARTNVTRAITRALAEISKQAPDLKQHLNNSTIKTGDKIGYHPIAGNEPTWILFKE